VSAGQERDERLAALAVRQFGIFTRDQALRLGYSPGGIARRLRAGRWMRVYRSVYRLQGVPESSNQRYLAATMYGRPDALLAGEAAGHKWGLAACRAVPPLIVTSRNLTDPHISLIRVPEPLPAIDRAVVDTIPITTTTRTLIDLAATVSPGRLQHVFDSAITRRLTTPDRVALRLQELNRRGRRGAGTLQGMVDEALRKPAPHSGLERTFLWLLSSAGYPEPARQFPVDIGWERPVHIDFAYPPMLIGIETDGYEPHASRSQWELDRRRDAALALLGWLILRFTRDDILLRQEYVLATLGEALRTRGAS
jgi:hypothetical protein